MKYDLFTLGVLSTIQATVFFIYLYKKKPPKKHVSFNTKENVIENTKENVIENTKENVIENIKENVTENTKENVIENTKENVIENIKENVTENTSKDKQEYKQEYIKQGLVLLSEYKQKLIILNQMIIKIQDEMMILRDNIQSQ